MSIVRKWKFNESEDKASLVELFGDTYIEKREEYIGEFIKEPTPPPSRYISETEAEPSAYGCSVCNTVFSPNEYTCPNCGADTWKKFRDTRLLELENRCKELDRVSKNWLKEKRKPFWRSLFKFWR